MTPLVLLGLVFLAFAYERAPNWQAGLLAVGSYFVAMLWDLAFFSALFS